MSPASGPSLIPEGTAPAARAGTLVDQAQTPAALMQVAPLLGIGNVDRVVRETLDCNDVLWKQDIILTLDSRGVGVQG